MRVLVHNPDDVVNMSMENTDLVRILVAERGPLLGFITSLCRDSGMAEDVYQTLVVIIAKKQPTVDSREGFLSWVRQAARFEVNNAMRKKQRTIALDGEVLELLERQWSSADRHTAAMEADALEQCLSQLTPRARDLLRLRFEEGLNGEELASAMGRKLNAIYVSLSRSYRQLADCIELRLVAEKRARRV